MAETEEQMPTFVEFFSGVHLAFSEFVLKWDKYPPNYAKIRERCLSVTLMDLASVIFLGVFFTFLRMVFNKLIFLPLAKWLRLRRSDIIKFTESMWKMLIYSILWSYCLYTVVLSGRYDFFQRPCEVMNFTLQTLGKPPADIHLMYICQIGFYLHSVYATVYMDCWRKDSITMIFHHFLTILLLYFSFSVGYFRVGALVLLLHDISDILLEITKINVYLKTRGGREHKINDILSSVGFLMFTVSWALCRLYWYPLKVLHATNYGVYKFHYNKDPQMYFPFNIMLFALAMLHIYWFVFIVLFFYKVATGQLKSVEDVREFEEEDEQDDDTEYNNVHSNNHLPSEKKKDL